MRAGELFDEGRRLLLDSGPRRERSDYLKAVANFESSRELFARLGDAPEARIAEVWAVQLLPDMGKLAESRARLSALVADAERRRYNVLLPAAHYRLGVTDFRRSSLSQTSRNYKTALRLAEADGNTFEVERAREALVSYYRDVHLLSNSHVFADLRKAAADEGDMIMHPSPGEAATGRPIGALVNFSAVKFDGGPQDPNHVDAALAKLWEPQSHRPLIPFVGAVKGHVAKGEVEVSEPARKFGWTTGYTEGRVFSIYLDIRVRYDRTGRSAFFANQILIEPNAPQFTDFVSKGDSGSLVVDSEQHALGLIFAGTSDTQQPRTPSPNPEVDPPAAAAPRRVQGYGVANPIAEVLDRLKIELVN